MLFDCTFIIIKMVNNNNYKYSQKQVTSRDHVTGSQSNMQNPRTRGPFGNVNKNSIHHQRRLRVDSKAGNERKQMTALHLNENGQAEELGASYDAHCNRKHD